VIEYMLSLSPKSKEKLAKSLIDKPKPNMSVMYADLKLSEEDVSKPTSSSFTSVLILLGRVGKED